jgi:hypothetical protein
LAQTEPWEGEWTQPVSVHFDAASGRWRMWYASTRERQVPHPDLRRGSLHLATSADGIHWDKSPLGRYRVGGHETNILVWEDGRPLNGAVVVFDEPQEADPSKRYKLIHYGPNYYLAYSADGLTWRPAQAAPVWANGSGDGLEETAFINHDPVAGKYRGWMRVWRRHQTIRKNGLGESSDLLTWTGPKICWEGCPDYGLGAQLYGMHVHQDAGLYWAFPWIFYTNEPMDEALHQTMRLKLGWSRDGRHWQPLAPEQDMVPMGVFGAFDFGMMLSHCPAVLTPTEGWLYYMGCDNIHDGSDRVRAIGMAKWRRGGLVSMSTISDDEPGTLLTRRFLFLGQELRLNARTVAGGSIQAELLDDGGSVVKTHRLTKSDAFTGDAQDQALSWDGSSDLSRFYGQYLMLRLRLHRAEVFSFRAAGPKAFFEAELGPPPVRVRRCLGAPTIDGILNEDCWQNFSTTGVAADFVTFERLAPAPVATRALVTHDDTQLFVAIECHEPLSAELPATRADSGPIKYRAEDCVEIRLSGPAHGSGIHYHQLIITSTGAMEHNYFSKEGGHCRAYLKAPWQARTSIVPGRWVIEAAIPFATLESPTPGPGERWRLNFIRHRQPGGYQTSCWVCQFGSVHRTDLAGDLVFG